jgi:hypothetical protein
MHEALETTFASRVARIAEQSFYAVAGDDIGFCVEVRYDRVTLTWAFASGSLRYQDAHAVARGVGSPETQTLEMIAHAAKAAGLQASLSRRAAARKQYFPEPEAPH